MARVGRFEYKLGGMRKADSFIVYPPNAEDPDRFLAQGSRTIVLFRVGEPKGIVNWRGSNPKYGPHLNPALGAELVEIPQEFKALCMEFRPGSGDEIGPGVTVA